MGTTIGTVSQYSIHEAFSNEEGVPWLEFEGFKFLPIKLPGKLFASLSVQ
jgi:hypothetical protein